MIGQNSRFTRKWVKIFKASIKLPFSSINPSPLNRPSLIIHDVGNSTNSAHRSNRLQIATYTLYAIHNHNFSITFTIKRNLLPS